MKHNFQKTDSLKTSGLIVLQWKSCQHIESALVHHIYFGQNFVNRMTNNVRKIVILKYVKRCRVIRRWIQILQIEKFMTDNKVDTSNFYEIFNYKNNAVSHKATIVFPVLRAFSKFLYFRNEFCLPPLNYCNEGPFLCSLLKCMSLLLCSFHRNQTISII